MGSKDGRPQITISISAAENDLINEECERTGEFFSTAIIRLAKLGLKHQAQAAAAKAVSVKAAMR